MPPLPLPNSPVVSCVFKFTYAADLDVQTKFFVRYSGSVNTNDMTLWLQNQESVAQGNWISLMHPGVILTSITGTDLTSPTGVQVVLPLSLAGTAVGSLLPASTAVLVNQKISRRYRGGKPRKYLPWGLESDLSSPQQWKPASVTAFQNGYNALAQGLLQVRGSFTPQSVANVSYYQGSEVVVYNEDELYERAKQSSLPRTGTAVVDDITSAAVNVIPGSQRRRLRPG